MFVVNESNPAKVDTYMSYIGEISLGDAAPEDTQPLGEGILFDFDSYSPELDKSGWPNDTSSGAQPDKIVAEIAEGKGIDGSSALAITRKNFGGSNSENNAEVRITLENPGLLGDNKYVRVWMDLSGDSVKVDFRKAAFGLITNNYTDLPFNTDEKDTPTSFWYMAEGSSKWVKMNHGDDGCFGAQQSSSVKGYKGWFAFPISNMPQRSTQATLGEDSYITHFYMYFCLADASMKGQCVYLDNIELVKDYTVFD